jgi:hypothetical protein
MAAIRIYRDAKGLNAGCNQKRPRARMQMEKTTTRKEKSHEENPVFYSYLGDGGIEPGDHFLRLGADVEV